MEKWIKNISGTIPYTNKTVNIDLDGRNLIVTGANGSGKTSFAKTLYNESLRCINEPNEGKNRCYFKTNLTAEISYQSLQFYGQKIEQQEALFKFFEEKRLSEIKQPKTGQQINADENVKLGNDLEQHLVNLISRQSYAIAMEKNVKLANDIQNWFNDFENKLKILFEDETVKLSFDPDRVRFSIIQKDKPPFTFQTLSAGYRAIFDIYADLLMHTEYFKIMPSELTGVVFIDEIDSHLHVSLQRLILPFFAQSFPKIQFIVTAHSPFVLMSTPDTVVYDLAKNELISEDLSYYTYSAVMEGLWDVKPIAAWVEDRIKEIERIVNSENKDIQRLKTLVDEIKGRESGLDSESKALFLLGKQTLLREERKNV